MPTNTGILNLVEPVGTDNPAELRESITANANALGDAFVPNYTTGSASMTAAANEVIVAAPGITVTLPSPVENAVVAIIASPSVTGASPVTISYGSAVIFGPGLSTSGVSSFELTTPGNSAWLIGTGTDWWIFASNVSVGALTGARAYSSANVSLTSTPTTVPLDTKSYDTGSNFSTSTYEYTCPATGLYQVNAMTTPAGGGVFVVAFQLMHNASIASLALVLTGQSGPIADLLQCTAGDTIYLQASTGGGTGPVLNLGSDVTYMSIVRVA